MNKIFIIGNGFDLAHGLPTSYSDFIDDFWKKLSVEYKKKNVSEVVIIEEINSGFLNLSPISSLDDLVTNIKEHSKEYGWFYDDKEYEYFRDKTKTHPIFKIQNNFFKELNVRKSIENWVDVENCYYDELKKIVKLKSKSRFETENGLLVKKKKLLRKLNLEFSQIKDLFSIYVKNEIVERYDFADALGSRFWRNYYDILMPFSINYDDRSKIGFEFTAKEDVTELENLYADQRDGAFFNTALFLCFNYTPTVESYFTIMRDDKLEVKLNYIHNRISDDDNSIIFGFGDEIDEDYMLIENINDNEYLANFKSFQYLQNSNYNRLLDYINFNRFQVCILGHSCGLSDRVLLNTIFEHENCRSIKVYYHKSHDRDNYTDVIQNISRHFKSKSLMRERVVNKEFSSAMIQVDIPLKKP